MPPIDHRAGVPANGLPGQVTLRTSCWACGEMLEKEVPRQALHHRYLSWRCDGCDVAWAGPGDAA
jgi:hypothetical protein